MPSQTNAFKFSKTGYLAFENNLSIVCEDRHCCVGAFGVVFIKFEQENIKAQLMKSTLKEARY